MNTLPIVIILQIFLLPIFSTFVVKPAYKFPFPEYEEFKVRFTPGSQGKLVTSSKDTLVLQIVNKVENVKEQVIYNFGSKDKIDDKYESRFIYVPSWKMNVDATAIDLSIMFKSLSNDSTLEIYFLSVSLNEIRQDSNQHISAAKILYSSVISLLVKSNFNMSIMSSNGTKDDLVIKETATTACKPLNNNNHPYFILYDNFDIINSSLNKENNEIKTSFKVSLADHLKTLRCVAGNQYDEKVVNVLHHPTKLVISPRVDRGVEPGNIISCSSEDGYPEPDIKWSLVEGPQDASTFYELLEKGKVIFLNTKSPLNAKWTFLCSAKSQIKSTEKTLERSISFVSKRAGSVQCGNNCLNLRLTKLEESRFDKDISDLNLFFKSLNKTVSEISNYINEQYFYIVRINNRDEVNSIRQSFNSRLTVLNENHEGIRKYFELSKINESLAFVENRENFKTEVEKLLTKLTMKELRDKSQIIKIVKDVAIFEWTVQYLGRQLVSTITNYATSPMYYSADKKFKLYLKAYKTATYTPQVSIDLTFANSMYDENWEINYRATVELKNNDYPSYWRSFSINGFANNAVSTHTVIMLKSTLDEAGILSSSSVTVKCTLIFI